ncbi:MAG: DNA-binding domain-containing protein [Neomegalonema sp.]|nr:DNA-binding domain-containing protein [Neomegalonema sp.]
MSAGQSEFSSALLASDAPIPGDVARGKDGAPARKRFNVYRNNVVVSLCEALARGFPVSQRLVGEAFFSAMASVYVRTHPPLSPLMIYYGETFPDWLAGFEPAQSIAWLPDIARIEWARRCAYHAGEAPVATSDDLGKAAAQIGAERLGELQLRLHPSVSVLRSAHPIFDLWQAAAGGEKAVAAGAQAVLVLRPEMEVTVSRCPVGAAAFVVALSSLVPLGASAAQAQEADNRFSLEESLSWLLAVGAITAIETGKI